MSGPPPVDSRVQYLARPCVLCRGAGFGSITDEKTGNVWVLCSKHHYRLVKYLGDRITQVIINETEVPSPGVGVFHIGPGDRVTLIPREPFDIVAWLKEEVKSQEGEGRG